jgi:hypothetical protein
MLLSLYFCAVRSRLSADSIPSLAGSFHIVSTLTSYQNPTAASGFSELQFQNKGDRHANTARAKEAEIMDFLHMRIFDPILQSRNASEKLKQGVRYTIMRMEQRDAEGMIQYYWSAIVGTERSISFAALMREEGFDRFEEALEEFRVRFNDDFLR